jgi:hypothetical protein
MTSIHHPQKHPRPLLRAAISAEILDLQAQRRATHDPFLRITIDARIKRLLALLQTVATAALLSIAVLPSPSNAQSRAPCSAYMDSRTCLRAIQNSTNLCMGRLHKAHPSPEETLACVRSAMTATGATFELEIEKPDGGRE